MNFGDILDAWEGRKRPTQKGEKNEKKASSQGAERTSMQHPAPSFSGRDKRQIEKKKESTVKESSGTREEGTYRSASELRDVLTAWLDVHGIEDKDKALDRLKEEVEEQQERRRRLLQKYPDATIDLHGCTRDEAWDALSLFFQQALREGAEKVLIIHGKGNHSPSEAVLIRTVRQFIERHPAAGTHGFAPPQWGGSGATWVILKHKKGTKQR
ncbi:MAG: Smr/MutS family protein [Breznakiellaceae bacterium]